MSKHDLHPRTAILNQKEKNKCKLARLKALAWLAEKFPEAFCNQVRIRPLKIGIMDDIIRFTEEASAAGISKSKLREAVVVFTRRIDYLTCLKAREMRIDLYGNPTGEVTEEEAEKATNKIRKRVEKSARNARKNLGGKTPSYYQKTERFSGSEERNTVSDTYISKKREAGDAEIRPYYPERPPAYSTHHSQSVTPKNATSVVVKHKNTKQYDPEAVARLKAKLGLNKKMASAIDSTSDVE